MSSRDLEKRIAALEEQVRNLTLANGARELSRDWRKTLGMFSGNDYMKQIDAAALAFRERDRRRARRKPSAKRRRAKS